MLVILPSPAARGQTRLWTAPERVPEKIQMGHPATAAAAAAAAAVVPF